MIAKLIETGFSEYEAKVYLALVKSHPVTAYEVAKASGVPTSKVYEVLARLQEKKVVSLDVNQDKKRFIPMAPDEFIESKRHTLETTLLELEQELIHLQPDQDVSYIWNIYDYSEFIAKATRMIQRAKKTILISAWQKELQFLEPFLKIKEKFKMRISIIHFGLTEVKVGQMFQHPIEETLFSEKGGRGLVIIRDGEEALMGTVSKEDALEGAASMNKGFVTLAEDYIKHDIYIMKIVKRFDKNLQKCFGRNYKKLRDVYKDEEVTA